MEENRRTYNMEGKEDLICVLYTSLLSALSSQIVLPFTQSTFFQDIIRGTTKILIKFRDSNRIYFFSCHRTPVIGSRILKDFFSFFSFLWLSYDFSGFLQKLEKKIDLFEVSNGQTEL
jgi:hypothetical protein